MKRDTVFSEKLVKIFILLIKRSNGIDDNILQIWLYIVVVITLLSRGDHF